MTESSELVDNMYVVQLPDDGRCARDFPVLREITSRLPVRRAFAHSHPVLLPHLCELIKEEDVGARNVRASRASHV